jgi:hypothetical protein
MYACCSHPAPLVNFLQEMFEKQQQELQQQLFAAEPSQLPALVYLALEMPNCKAELLIAAATGRGELPLLREGISRFPEQAQQALQQQLAGEQLLLLLRAAITREKSQVVQLLLAQPDAQLSADDAKQLLQLAMHSAYYTCGKELVKCPAAGEIPPAGVAELLDQALKMTAMPRDFWGNAVNVNFCHTALIGLAGAQGIDTATVVKLLSTAIAGQQQYAVAELSQLPASEDLSSSDVQKLLQQAVTADRTAAYYDPDEDEAYAGYAQCVEELSRLPAAQEVPVAELRCLVRQAFDKEDGEMVAALLRCLRATALGLSSADVLKFLQAAVVLKHNMAAVAAVEELSSLVDRSYVLGNDIELTAEQLEQLLATAMQLEYDGLQRSGVAEVVARLRGMDSLPTAAIGGFLEAAVEHDVEGVVRALCELDNAVDLPKTLLARLISLAVDKRMTEHASDLCDLLQRAMSGGYASGW